MSSFFQDGDDSEEERMEAQKRTLESIRKDDALTEKKVAPPEQEQVLSNVEAASEEKELEALRENIRYKEYATASRKRAEITRERERKRQRINILSGETSDDEDEADRSRVPEDAVLHGSRRPHGVTEHDRDPVPCEATSTPGAVPSRKRERSKPQLDPKIIDDSSDESSNDESESDEEAPLGPVLPPSSQPRQTDLSAIKQLPIHNQATLGTAHASYVSCLALDAPGNRLVSGSLDSSAKFWDFHAMNRSLRSFRAVSPLLEDPIRNIQYSSTGRALLFSGGSNSAIVTDREGVVLSQTAKGDMYIVDSARTNGHTGPVHDAKWKPSGSAPSTLILTTSADATIRMWNIERARRVPMVDHAIAAQEKVTKLRNERGGKIIASAFDWLPDGRSCVLGCSDARLRIIDPSSYALKPQSQSDAIIASGEEVTSVVCAPDSCAAPLVLVRSSDDSLRVFDRRSFSKPVKEFQRLPNTISETNACFIGDTGDHFMTGTSAKKGGTSKGTIRVFDRQRMEEIWKSELDEGTGSAVCTLWHSSINQCIVGTGDGRVHVMYHSEQSQRGVLSCLSKKDYRKTHGVVSLGYNEAIPASSLYGRGRSSFLTQQGQDEAIRSKRHVRELSNARKPKQISGPPSGLQTPSISMAQHLAAKDVSSKWAQDPREAILKYADIAKQDPQFTTAYQKTQPEVILAEKTAEQEEEETRRAIYERDRTKRTKPQ